MKKNLFLFVSALLFISLSFVISSSFGKGTPPSQSVLGVTAVPQQGSSDIALANSTGIGQRTKTSGCQRDGANQDMDCTPGAILPVAKEQVCVSGYSSS